MSTPFRTTFSLAEITFVGNAFSRVCDDLLDRNGDRFKASTVDVLGDAEDAFKLLAGEITEREIAQ